MTIYLAADHAGFALKEKVKAWLKGLGYQVHDEGAFELDQDDDYPDFVKVVAKQVASDPEGSRGLLFGGSGQGEAMTANRYRGVRATVYYGGDEQIITLSRTHNNANILSFGARFVDPEKVTTFIKTWLGTPFSNEPRHQRRHDKMDNLIADEQQF